MGRHERTHSSIIGNRVALIVDMYIYRDQPESAVFTVCVKSFGFSRSRKYRANHRSHRM